MNRKPKPDSDSDPLIEATEEDAHAEPFVEIDVKSRAGRLNIAPRHQIVLVYAIGMLLVLLGFAAILGTAAYLASVIDFKLSHVGYVVWLLFSFLCLWWWPAEH